MRFKAGPPIPAAYAGGLEAAVTLGAPGSIRCTLCSKSSPVSLSLNSLTYGLLRDAERAFSLSSYRSLR